MAPKTTGTVQGHGDNSGAGGGAGDPGRCPGHDANDRHHEDEPLIAGIAEDQGNADEGLDDGIEATVGVILHIQGQAMVNFCCEVDWSKLMVKLLMISTLLNASLTKGKSCFDSSVGTISLPILKKSGSL